MQHLRPEERREFQRLRLTHSIAATLGGHPVKLIEIGILGARVKHLEELRGDYAELRFPDKSNEIAMKCEVVRSNEATAQGLESAVRFLAAIGDSGARLRALLAELVLHELDFRRTHPGSVVVEVETIDGDKTVRGADAGFLCYRFENGGWTRRRVFLPEQPAVGFTVARTEDNAEMQRLCRIFESADEEGRRLIRLFAELSVSDALEIPPRL